MCDVRRKMEKETKGLRVIRIKKREKVIALTQTTILVQKPLKTHQ